jgi:D-alanyl-D-alanine carboxypeptidase
MKKLTIILFSGIILLACGCRKNNTSRNPYDVLLVQQKLQTMADYLMAGYKAKYPEYPGGLAVKVIYKGNSWFVTSGMGQGVTGDWRFRAASNTKLFTASAILLLYQQGKLNLDASITDLIPGTNMTYVPMDANFAVPFRERITIRQLLQNKAGVFDIVNDKIPDTVSVPVPYKGQNYLDWAKKQDSTHTFTFDELVGVDATCRLYYFEPGTSYHYSDTGWAILGKIIERVSGQRYSDFIMNEIFVPMGLVSSSMPYLGTDNTLPSPYVKGYYYDATLNIDATWSNVSPNVADGTLITTPNDLSKFIRTLLRGEGVLSAVTVNSVLLSPMVPPDTMMTYYCGIETINNLGYGHDGDKQGYSSRMAYDPELDFAVVAFTNGNNLFNGMISFGELVDGVVLESCYKAKLIVL